MATRTLLNPHVAPPQDYHARQRNAPLAFHRRLPSYAPTPLVDAAALATKAGLGRVWVKNESSRLGLPAFKILGASWATYRALISLLGQAPAPWTTVDDLRERFGSLGPLTLVTATDGNHGRAVAHTAAWLGYAAHIFVPAGTAAARIAAIQSEGASVTEVDGTYDDAVACAAREASDRHIVISDTSWPGYEDVPRWVIEGYSTIFAEIEDQLAQLGETGPDLVFVQMGVGALAAAVVQHFHQRDADPPARIVGVEPSHAACVLASAEAGRIVTLPGPQDSIMAGLNCGTPASVAWPYLASGIDLFLAVDDEWSERAMRAYADANIVAGETGAAGLAGLLALLADAPEMCERLAITPDTRALVICTEGATDPANYERIVHARNA